MVLFLPLLGAASVAGAGATCVYLGFQTGFPPSSNGPAMADIAALKPVFFPAAASICLLYVFLMAQSASAFAAHRKHKSQSALRGDKAPSLGEVKYGGKAVGVLMMDRTVGNFLEQALPFYLGLFLHAILVSPNAGAKTGWLWILFRSYYPIVWGMNFPAVLSSTMPAYLCVLYLWWGVMATASSL